MFGILTVLQPEGLSAAQRAALRLRPGKGLQYGEGLFRMAMFVTATVTLEPGETYRNYNWILTKTMFGWELRTWGYG